MSNRKKIIDEIISDLNGLTGKVEAANQYALQENIIFFRAAKSFFTFLAWLVWRTPNIDGSKLLELADFSIEKWEKAVYNGLITLEKSKFPGYVEPLINRIVDLVVRNNAKRVSLLALGCGGMEVERQVIERINSLGINKTLVIFGLDQSFVAHEIAKKNLAILESTVDFYDINNLDKQKMELLTFNLSSKHVVVLCKNNIKEITSFKIFFDILYSSLFMHHLNKSDKEFVGNLSQKIARTVLVYDGYRRWINFIPQVLSAWNNPAMLNGAVLSNIRYLYRKDINAVGPINFFPKLGNYLSEVTPTKS